MLIFNGPPVRKSLAFKAFNQGVRDRQHLHKTIIVGRRVARYLCDKDAQTLPPC